LNRKSKQKQKTIKYKRDVFRYGGGKKELKKKNCLADSDSYAKECSKTPKLGAKIAALKGTKEGHGGNRTNGAK